jgi:hypothetical protein
MAALFRRDMKNKKSKYPRTPHLPWSQGTTKDDKKLSHQQVAEMFGDKEIVITEKMDGENTTMYKEGIHARSVNSLSNETQSWIKAFHASFSHVIPSGWRVCGENMYAKHSIHYNDLSDYFYVFSIWDNSNYCLDWDNTVSLCLRWGLTHVKELYIGRRVQSFDYKIVENEEGYVIRNTCSFHYDDFGNNVAKFVKAGHVRDGDTHWSKKPLIKNLLR